MSREGRQIKKTMRKVDYYRDKFADEALAGGTPEPARDNSTEHSFTRVTEENHLIIITLIWTNEYKGKGCYRSLNEMLLDIVQGHSEIFILFPDGVSIEKAVFLIFDRLSLFHGTARAQLFDKAGKRLCAAGDVIRLKPDMERAASIFAGLNRIAFELLPPDATQEGLLEAAGFTPEGELSEIEKVITPQGMVFIDKVSVVLFLLTPEPTTGSE